VYTDATWGLNRLPGASDINERNVRARARDRRPVADAEACTATVASSDVRVCIRRVWLVDRRADGGWGWKFCRRASAIYRVSRAKLLIASIMIILLFRVTMHLQYYFKI